MTHYLSDIRVAALAKNPVIKFLGPLIDRITGLNKLQHLYRQHQFSGLDKQTFSTKLLQVLGVQILGSDNILDKIPEHGRCIVVCNHPYGMIEGIIIANLLTQKRPDTKIMANVGLQIFKEIKDYFIFADPLKPKSPINNVAIKQCFKHLKNDGVLVLFPAGRVSFYQKDQKIISDGDWDRLTVQLMNRTTSPILTVFISGTNSKLFHRMGRIYYRFRLLMLAREMLKLDHHTIKLLSTNIMNAEQFSEFKDKKMINDVVRLQCYLNDERYIIPWQIDEQPPVMAELIAPSDKTLMQSELANLSEQQHLLDYRSFSVYYAYQRQAPQCIREITRLREQTFRDENEGSGQSCDTDKFDETYMHLFIFDNKNNEIIGAYRIGLTDQLLKSGDQSSLYLSQMFNFSANFINQQQPCMEMGRSFIVKAHQHSFYGLLLLWKGIGAFVCQNPQYRTLYGTVSLSKLYDPRSITLINKIMVTDTDAVHPKIAFENSLHPELVSFLTKHTVTAEQLSSLVKGIEQDSKDIPILLKQYHKLRAVFHCLGIDGNFNTTPGLLLSVDLPKAPDKLLKLYLGVGKDAYLAYKT
ncbi:MAG: lysophospholipid acyltransferase family protein [Alteromonadaceae bacterium]|nr:lysophospholipid acyltransferase family protein [Alteromonadaceae bacterium]